MANYTVSVELEELVSGDTFKGATFSDLQDDGVPIDLTGATITAWFRKDRVNGPVIKRISTASGITITDAAAGTFQFDAFTEKWDPGIYYFDVEFRLANGTVRTYISGVQVVGIGQTNVTY